MKICKSNRHTDVIADLQRLKDSKMLQHEIIVYVNFNSVDYLVFYGYIWFVECRKWCVTGNVSRIVKCVQRTKVVHIYKDHKFRRQQENVTSCTSCVTVRFGSFYELCSRMGWFSVIADSIMHYAGLCFGFYDKHIDYWLDVRLTKRK